MDKYVKKLLNKGTGGERGFALPLVLILLLMGSLIITPLLSYTSTGLRAGKSSEQHMERLYAADAGVEDAIWHLISENVTMNEGDTENLPPSTINDKTVDVTIEALPDAVYKITSVATDNGSTQTTLEVFITGLDFSSLFDNAVTSRGAVKNKGDISGNVTEYYDEDWPTKELLIEHYLAQVDIINDNYGSDTVDVKTTPVILPGGPLYRDGDLEIYKSPGGGNTLGTLDGTIYVTGDLDLSGPKDFTLDLNGQTIFVEGAIDITQFCTITGSGCIIAIGDIFFSPQTDNDPNNFVFVMSVEGTIKMNPLGNFYGSLAGDVEVTVQPGSEIIWTDPSGTDFNFPDGITAALEILSWRVSP